MKCDVKNKTYQEINAYLRENGSCEIINIIGQRYLGNAMRNGEYTFRGYVGNAMCSFLDGAKVELYGNAQEACGTTMSSGQIVIHGNCGDALAYGMRGGDIFIDGKCGSRCGVHMKRYKDKKSLLVIGETAGDFLGEYNSGGIILVLNQNGVSSPVGLFCGMGAHDGQIIIRMVNPVIKEGYKEIKELTEVYEIIERFSKVMDKDDKNLKEGYFYQVGLEVKNPYEGLYIND